MSGQAARTGLAAANDERRQVGPSAPALIAPIDVLLLAGLPTLAALSWLLPAAGRRRLARACAPFQLREMTGDAAATADKIARACGGRLGGEAVEDVLTRLAAHNLDAILLLLRALRPFTPAPAVRLVGGEHVAAALAHGHGAILWTGHFTHASVVAKIAWHRAGYRAIHLSHPRHGFSSSRFGMRVLNAIARVAEDRYIDERVLVGLDSSTAALRALARRLAQGRVVSISVRMSARPIRVPFLDGELGLATGALDLGFRTGAPVLPVFVTGARGGYEVTVEAPLPVPRSLPRRQATDAAARAYAARLEPWVLRHADQWLGWLNL